MEKQKLVSGSEDPHTKFIYPKNVYELHKNSLSRMDKFALFVTDRIGTMGFFFIILGWTIFWLTWNIVAPTNLKFDPYPAFVLWLFISNLIQIHLMPLIMVGQHIQGKHTKLRSEHDYEMDKRRAKEVEMILHHLESQQQLMLDILKRIDRLEKK